MWPSQWVYLGAISNAKQHNLFFRNNGGTIPPAGKFCSFHFDIKGKTVTPSAVAITLASSLSGDAKTADVNGSNQSTSTELYVKASATVVIPTVLSDFSITAKDCDALLSWKTVSENNIESFDIEYGTNGLQFDKIGAVQGKNNAEGSAYDYVKDQGNGKGYYRLKIIERDGKISYSKIASIDTKCIIKKGF